MKILITPKSFKNYKEKTYPILQNLGCEIVENKTGRTLTEDEIIDIASQDVQGIIIGVDPLPKRVLESCKDLKAISKYGVGMDNIDLEAAEKLNIKVKNAVGSNNISVAELAIALIFEAARRVSVLGAGVRNGNWGRIAGVELTGKTIGIIGGGQIGKEVAKRAKGLCMEVLIYDPYYNDFEFLEKYGITLCDSLDKILSLSDIVSMHLPLTTDTKYIINTDTLKMMKPSAILINTSRGELVDEESLYTALKEKVIAFAAQDVFSKEPPSPDEKLLTLDNFILTPHAGAFTAEAVERMALYSTNNLVEMLNL
ncbi:phosphoglycerate dehydrogenase [Petroclostridium sp. X23]|uniref:phosphoglycerate dehydrogenase n=1 Tax=Petroclostridium sp. X23 TaxID=3045146 RepID=UPI0024AE016E|nr:phosphoglycerate dehydrogenase [Petroclostridium sp. X23]WHH58176.1 phosphoglycerate dehydrogenase [Petroclostridium sp. X23]